MKVHAASTATDSSLMTSWTRGKAGSCQEMTTAAVRPLLGDEDRTSSKKFGVSLLIGKQATELYLLPEDAQLLLALATVSH